MGDTMNGGQITADRATEILAGQAKLEGMVSTVTARLDAFIDRNRDESRALFDRTNKHTAGIAAIERDYVPQAAFEEHRRQQREDLEQVHKQIGEIKTSVTRIVSIAACAWVVLATGLQFLLTAMK